MPKRQEGWDYPAEDVGGIRYKPPGPNWSAVIVGVGTALVLFGAPLFRHWRGQSLAIYLPAPKPQ